jgi:acetate kinase
MNSEGSPTTLLLPAIRADRPMFLLALNCGSASLKWDLFDTQRPELRWSGRVAGLGQAEGLLLASGPGLSVREPAAALDPAAAVDRVLDLLADRKLPGPLSAVGHRVLFGGQAGSSAEPLDPAGLEALRRLSAPWSQAGRLSAVARCLERVQAPQVAVFDHAFFRTLPEVVRAFALPQALAARHGLERQGFHGLSHKHAALRAAEALGRPLTDLKLVTAHLGHGASACAVDHGRAVDTTGGLTPLGGLPALQRPGDLDPGLLLHLLAAEGLTPARAMELLDREAGLAGLAGVPGGMLELEAAAERGAARAQLAVQLFCHRVRAAVGALAASLDGLDALVFTGGVGEGSAGVRARVCQGLGHLGLVLEEGLNRSGLPEGRAFTAVHHPASRVKLLLARSDEGHMIARETLRALGREAAYRAAHLEPERPVTIGVSAHHVHLSQAHVEALFGPGHALTPGTALRQPGQFAAQERVDLVGPRGRVERVRVLGPTRAETQVEISRTEEFQLGLDAPIRDSGDLRGTPGLTLEGPAGRVALDHGVICARRHIHMGPGDAALLGVKDKDVVLVEVRGARPLVFGDVLVRVKPDYVLEMHVDTDEANAAELSTGALGTLRGLQSRPG